jgi:glycolate oxidase FAD binding subunit
LATTLSEAASSGFSVRFCGGRTKFDWGAPVAADVEISTLGLDQVVEHNVGDLTAVLDAGVRLADAQAAFAAEGQMFALDPPDGGATIGGVVATADSGPLRHRYGSVRDLVVGMTVALSDGTVAKSGGKVIKNVAGYDLAKLFAGAYGTLGAILQVAVRLHPVAPSTVTALGHSDDPRTVAAAASAVTHARLELESLDVRWEQGTGTVLARSGGAAAAEAADGVSELLAREGLDASVHDDDVALWDAQRAGQRSQDATVVRVSGLQDQTTLLLELAHQLDARVVTRAAFGLSWVTLSDAAQANRLREALAPSACVVLDGRGDLDPWGPRDPGALALAERVRERFDPAGACAPGLLGSGA